MGPSAPARRCEARWTTLALAGLADLQHVPAEAVDRNLAPGMRVCPSDLLYIGETVRIDAELDVVAGADAFAVPEHREVPGSVDVFDDAGDVCPLSISDVEDSLPPTYEDIGLPRWSVGHLVRFRHRRGSSPVPHAAATEDGQSMGGRCSMTAIMTAERNRRHIETGDSLRRIQPLTLAEMRGHFGVKFRGSLTKIHGIRVD